MIDGGQTTKSFLTRALDDGHAKLIGEGKIQRIVYLAVNHSERFNDPEEQMRAQFWAELIYRYGYEPGRIGVEITVPDRTPACRQTSCGPRPIQQPLRPGSKPAWACQSVHPLIWRIVHVHVELLLGDGELGLGVEDDDARLPAPEMKSSFPAV